MIWAFIALLAVHWFGDFVCQSDWMAKNKSKRFDALALHTAVYTLILGVGSFLILDPGWGLVKFVVLNGLLHLMTDFFTSRLSSFLYAKGKVHDFFVVIGADQLIHQITLAVTLVALTTGRL